jgi:hypothetical protein
MMDAVTAADDGDIQMIDTTSVRAHKQAATTIVGSRGRSLSRPSRLTIKIHAVICALRGPAVQISSTTAATFSRRKNRLSRPSIMRFTMPSMDVPRARRRMRSAHTHTRLRGPLRLWLTAKTVPPDFKFLARSRCWISRSQSPPQYDRSEPSDLLGLIPRGPFRPHSSPGPPSPTVE